MHILTRWPPFLSAFNVSIEPHPPPSSCSSPMAGSQLLPSKPNSLLSTIPPSTRKYSLRKIPSLVSAVAKGTEEHDAQNAKGGAANLREVLSRRREVVIGAMGVAVATQTRSGVVRAEEEGNGWWLTGPLPVPTVENKELVNKDTGTRSFVQNGIYMANIGADGSQYRLRQYAFDLMTLGDLMGQDAWSYMRRYLRLKSTFMYFDFDKIISAAPVDQKQPLTDLANRLFDSLEKLEDAIKIRDDPAIESCYASTTPILQEVRTRMA